MWESHADPEIRRVCKPVPDPIYVTYVISDSDKVVEEIRVVAVTKPKSTSDQMEELIRRLPAGMAAPAPVPASAPEVPAVDKLLLCLVAEKQSQQPAPVVTPEPAGLENLLRSLLSGQVASGQQLRQGSFRCDWNAVVCFSCGKAGHSVTRCPTPTATDPGGGGGGSPPGSVVMFDPRTPGEAQLGSPFPGKVGMWR